MMMSLLMCRLILQALYVVDEYYYTKRKLPEWHIHKKYITNEDKNIIRVRSMSITLLIFMTERLLLCMSNYRCFTPIIHHF